VGCCGRKSRVEASPVPRGHAVREIAVRPVAMPMTPPAPPRPPAGSPGFSATIQPTKTVVCKRCGARLALKHVWSGRLRRYYDVSWCPGCGKGG